MRAITSARIRNACVTLRDWIVAALALFGFLVLRLFVNDPGDDPDDDEPEIERLDTDYDPVRAMFEPVPVEIDKGLTDNRDRYIAQSAATRDGIVAELDQAA